MVALRSGCRGLHARPALAYNLHTRQHPQPSQLPSVSHTAWRRRRDVYLAVADACRRAVCRVQLVREGLTAVDAALVIERRLHVGERGGKLWPAQHHVGDVNSMQRRGVHDDTYAPGRV